MLDFPCALILYFLVIKFLKRQFFVFFAFPEFFLLRILLGRHVAPPVDMR